MTKEGNASDARFKEACIEGNAHTSYFRIHQEGVWHSVSGSSYQEKSECGVPIREAVEFVGTNISFVGTVCDKCASGVGMHNHFSSYLDDLHTEEVRSNSQKGENYEQEN